MAGKREDCLEKLEEQLTCSVCLDQFVNPKILPCHHSFCLGCLEATVQRGDKRRLSCPSCRTDCKLPEEGVASLPPSFVINNFTEVYGIFKKAPTDQHIPCNICETSSASRYCKQCAKFLCQECLLHHNNWKPNARHHSLTLNEVANAAHQLPGILPQAANGRGDDEPTNCTDHNKPLEIFCKTCDELICHNCTVRKHKGHDYDVVSDTCEKYRSMLESRLGPLDSEADQLSEVLESLNNRAKEISEQGESTKQEIAATVSHLKDLLDEKQKELYATVDSAVEHKTGVLGRQMKGVTSELMEVRECKDSVEQSLKEDTPQKLLSSQSSIISRTECVTRSAKKKRLQPALEQADIRFIKAEKIDELHIDIGSVTCAYMYQPAKVEVSCCDALMLGQESTVTIVFSHTDGSPLSVPSSLVSCHLTSSGEVQTTECLLKESPQSAGQYNVVFTPTTRGLHQLHVSVLDAVVHGSPLAMSVSTHADTMGTPVKTITGLKEPGGVAVTDDGLVIVSDTRGHCIKIFDTEGGLIRTFGSRGTKKGELKNPQGVAVSVKGTILVADFANCRIQEFTMDGKCELCIGSKGSGPLQFNEPLGITVRKATGQVYIADRRNNRIQVLNSDLMYSFMFGSSGSGQGNLNLPHDVDIDDEGFVYVADFGNNRVQKFSPDGQSVLAFGTNCEGNDSLSYQLTHPDGITVDGSSRMVFVSEGKGTNRLSVFTTAGEYVRCIDDKGFYRRSAMDKLGHLHVCFENSVIVF